MRFVTWNIQRGGGSRLPSIIAELKELGADVITLTDLSTGRYVMVNQTFEAVTGFRAAEVVGRTSMELGVWAQPEQRQTFVSRIEEEGSVKDMPVTVAVDSSGTSVHNTGPKEWQAKIGKIPVAVA